MRKKRRLKLKWLILLFVIFSFILLFSLINIIKYIFDNKNTNNQIASIKDNVIINDTQDTNAVEIINQEGEIPKSNPYWDYIKMNLINVNLDELKAKNNDTKGWIQVNGTNINYPFVQTSDNNFYLNHSFDKSYNKAGWVFLDYRNNFNDDKNTIIYAHGRLDKTMFGSLRNIFTKSWLNNTDNYIIKLSNDKENSLWQVFSIYHIPTTSDYIKTEFNSNYEFQTFTNMLINRSTYNFNTTVSENDRILTLSTCYNDKEKAVLHAKLIKYEKK